MPISSPPPSTPSGPAKLRFQIANTIAISTHTAAVVRARRSITDSLLVGELHDAVDVEHARREAEEEADEHQPRLGAKHAVEPVSGPKSNHQRENERHSDRAHLPD